VVAVRHVLYFLVGVFPFLVVGGFLILSFAKPIGALGLIIALGLVGAYFFGRDILEG
jgi:hypothetical protein